MECCRTPDVINSAPLSHHCFLMCIWVLCSIQDLEAQMDASSVSCKKGRRCLGGLGICAEKLRQCRGCDPELTYCFLKEVLGSQSLCPSFPSSLGSICRSGGGRRDGMWEWAMGMRHPGAALEERCHGDDGHSALHVGRGALVASWQAVRGQPCSREVGSGCLPTAPWHCADLSGGSGDAGWRK